MKLLCLRTSGSTLALMGGLWWSVAANAAEFEVGFATADITPPAGWRRAGGYSEVVSTGVHDPLFTKAMVLSQGETVVAFVGNDLCSVPRELTDRARRRACEKTGIPFANMVITATHTHGGPEYYGPLRDFLHARAQRENGGNDPREAIDYHARLVDRWVEVIGKAHAARRPASLSVTVPLQQGVAFNRRFLMKDGSTGWNPGKLPQEVQAIRLDRDTALVTLPHEVFVELGLAIKSASPFRTTIVVSLANDLDFYLPTRRAFEEGHYEPTTCPLEPGCGERLVQAAVNLLHELKP